METETEAEAGTEAETATETATTTATEVEARQTAADTKCHRESRLRQRHRQAQADDQVRDANSPTAGLAAIPALSAPSQGRAVSNVIGFTVILGIVFSGIIVVFAFGGNLLLDLGDSQTQESNLETTAGVQTELNDMAAGGIATRRVDTTWTDAQLSLNGSPDTVLIVSAPDFGVIQQYNTSRFQVALDDQDVMYTAAFGHVYQVDEPMSSDPGYVSEVKPAFGFSEREVSLTLPALDGVSADSPASIGGTGKVSRTLTFSQQTSGSVTREQNDNTLTTVNISVRNVPDAGVWAEAFRESGATAADISYPDGQSGDRVRVSIDTRRLSLFTASMEVNLDG